MLLLSNISKGNFCPNISIHLCNPENTFLLLKVTETHLIEHSLPDMSMPICPTFCSFLHEACIFFFLHMFHIISLVDSRSGTAPNGLDQALNNVCPQNNNHTTHKMSQQVSKHSVECMPPIHNQDPPPPAVLGIVERCHKLKHLYLRFKPCHQE